MLRWIALAAVLVAAIAFPWGHWVGAPGWSPDGLFYESQRLEVGGETSQTARARVFFTDPRYAAARDDAFPPSSPTRASLLNPPWVAYTSQFYRRRWAVPIAAEAVAPLFGRRSLQVVSIAGYVALGLLLFAWLRLRFDAIVSAAVAIGTLALPSLREWSFLPLTDSWGLAVLVLALYAAYRALSEARPWAAVFVGVVGVGSFVRDDGIVAIVALALLGLASRRRDALLLAALGFLAMLPASLAFGAPARAELSYTLNDYQPAPDGWHFVVHHYPHGVAQWLSADVSYARHHAGTTLFVLGGIALLLACALRGDVYLRFAVCAAAGGLAFLLVNPNPAGTAFRLELVLVPASAVGVAAAIAGVTRYVAQRR